MELVTVVTPKPRLEREYERALVIGGPGSAHLFERSLHAVAVAPADRIYALGDDEVRLFEPDGTFVRAWTAPAHAICLAVGREGRVHLAGRARVETWDAEGSRLSAFTVGDTARPARITAIKAHGDELLVADAAARFIRRVGADGRPLGVIGARTKTGGFMLPNGSLDFDVDAHGVVRAGDTGRHRVSAWTLEGEPLGFFGKFGHQDPGDFVGCCNPVNLGCAPDGKVVTAEKMIARVKVYAPDGRLLALIGPPSFDPLCRAIPVAVDTKGRILAADTVGREVKVFARKPGEGGRA
jgi:hypothetical protein